MQEFIERRNRAIAAAYRMAKAGSLGAARKFIRQAVGYARLDRLQYNRLLGFFAPGDLYALGVREPEEEEINRQMDSQSRRLGSVRP